MPTETLQTVKEICTSGIVTAAVAIVTAFIGTWFGAWVIIRRQEASSVYPRKLLQEILNTLRKYDTYRKAEDDFNTRSTVEKKAVLVALKNLGVPIQIDVVNDSYDVNHVHFDDVAVNKEAIDKMRDFVKKGLCDDLFFKEVGANFYNASPKIIFARNLALNFLEALAVQSASAKVIDVMRVAKINLNQFQVINVFWNTVDVLENSTISQSKIIDAKSNVRNGVFDHLFYWDIRAFDNMNSQRNLADNVNRLAVAPVAPVADAERTL